MLKVEKVCSSMLKVEKVCSTKPQTEKLCSTKPQMQYKAADAVQSRRRSTKPRTQYKAAVGKVNKVSSQLRPKLFLKCSRGKKMKNVLLKRQNNSS